MKLIMSEQTRSYEITKELQNALLLVYSIESALSLPILAQSVINHIKGLASGPMVGSLTASDTSNGHFAEAKHCMACPSLVNHARSQLRHALTGVVLKSILTSPEINISPSTGLVTKILKAYGQHAVSEKFECPNQPVLESIPRLSILETACTPDELPTRVNWRGAVQYTLTRGTEHQYRSLIQQVEHVCRDLERRCDEVEKPLHEEQARLEDLKNKFNEKHDLCESLQMQMEKVKDLLIKSESRKREIDDDRGHLQHQIDEMTRELDNIKRQSCQEKEDAIAVAERTATAARKQDLTYIETMRSKDEALLELKMATAAAKAHSEELSKKLTASREDHRTTCERVEHIEKELGSSKDSLCSLRAALNDKNEQVQQLSGLKELLEKNIDDAERESRDVKRKYDIAIEELKEGLADVRSEHDRALRVKDDGIRQMHEEFQETISNRDEEIKLLEEERRATAQSNAKMIAELESRNADLRRECQKRDQEVTRIREASSKFLGAVGMKRTHSAHPIFWAECRSENESSLESTSTVSFDQEPLMRRTHVQKSPDHKRSKTESKETHSVGETATTTSGAICTTVVSRKTLGLLDHKRQNAQKPQYICHKRRQAIVSPSGLVSGEDQENCHTFRQDRSDDLSTDTDDTSGSTASV